MICKNCKKLIDDDSKFCKNCGKPVEVDEPWNKRICRDEGLWHNEIFQNSPSIIAHEYNRVYELLLENKTYGAMMQIKDLLEVLIKIPVIIEMARLQAKKDKNDKDYEFLLELVRKPLSLGDWRKAIITMNKSNEHFFENEFISDLCKIYMSNIGCQNEFIDVVNWRNQTIGHGALAFDNDEKFKTELKTLLLILSNHFKKWEKVYKDIEIYQKGKEDIVFSGKDYALNLEYDDCELWVRINENIKLSLYPFLLLWDKQFYIFDALIYNKEKYDVLCYPIGQKKHFKKQDRLQKHVKDIYYQCNKVLNRNKILSNSIEYDPSAEDEVILTSLDDFLNASEEKIFEMNMLDKWLANSLQESQDKILLLMMERGERVIIVMGAVCVKKPRVSGTLYKYISCIA